MLWRKAACLAHRKIVEPPGPGRVIGSAPRQAGPLPAPLGGALIRQGGGLNGKAVSKANCSWWFCGAYQQVQWAVGVAGQAAFWACLTKKRSVNVACRG